MKQKKRIEAEREMGEKNKALDWKFYLTEILMILVSGIGIWILGRRIKELSIDNALSILVSSALCIGVMFFYLRKIYYNNEMDYNNAQHIYRFLLCFVMGLAVSFVCVFLPVGGWPFLGVYVTLSLFSNMNEGILSASTLLLITVLLHGENVNAFVLYFVSGVFAVALFDRIKEEFKPGTPLFLSLMCLLVCETANTILIENVKPTFEEFVIPVSNLILSGLLILLCLKLFSAMVFFQYRSDYLEIADTENEILFSFREKNKDLYMHCIHTAYFCERLGNRLDLDTNALKVVAYYYQIVEQNKEMLNKVPFPPAAKEILNEYLIRKVGYQKKETGVLICSDFIVKMVTKMNRNHSKASIDYDRLVDMVFKKLIEENQFSHCDLSMRELETMKRIFKEESLYYDFIH